MKPFSELIIRQYRGIKGLTFKGLGNVNILVGDNNVGKTSMLEAIYCFRNPDKAYSVVQAARTRRNYLYSRTSTFDMFMSVFPFGEEKRIEIEAEIFGERHNMKLVGDLERRIIKDQIQQLSIWDSNENNGDEHSDDLELRFVEKEVDCFSGTLLHNDLSDELLLRSDGLNMSIPISSFWRISFVSAYSHLSKAIITREAIEYKKEIISLLKMFDDKITGFDLVRNEETRTTTEFIRHKKLGVVPLYTFGDGLKRVLLLATSLVNSRDGVLLIDEIEASIHVSVLADVFTWLLKASKKFNVQIFASTHSNEALKEITTVAIEDESSDLVAYRIEKFDGAFYTKRFAENQLNYVINEKGQDIR